MNTKRSFSLFGIACMSLLLLLTSACIKQKVTIKVKPDGSGQLVVTRIFNNQTAKMIEKRMEEMKKTMGANPNMKMPEMDPFYNEQQLKMEAKRYGADVEFVKGMKLDKKYGKGSMAIYSFKNINDLDLGMGSPMGAAGGQKDKISFALEKGSPNVLTINMPEIKEPEKKEMTEAEKAKAEQQKVMRKQGFKGNMERMMASGNPYGLKGDETEVQVMQKILKDMSVEYEIEVEGDISKTNATFRDPKKKNRILLFSVDFNKLLEDEKLAEEMMDGMNPGAGKSMTEILNKPGVKYDKNKQITIDFK